MELYDVEGPMLIGVTLDYIDGNGSFQQSPLQSLCIGDTAAGENPRLMLPARMMLIEAVSFQLAQINMSPISVRQFHPRRFSPFQKFPLFTRHRALHLMLLSSLRHFRTFYLLPFTPAHHFVSLRPLLAAATRAGVASAVS
jgi:hypothetical protein